MNLLYTLKRALFDGKFKKIMRERLTEPVHLNVISAFVALFGKYQTKVAFDLVVRQQYAYSVLHAAESALETGVAKKVTLIEFGVAAGAGLLNLCKLAEATTKATGIEFEIYGFDTGTGMPPAVDYRDLPEVFQQGDFPMDFEALQRVLPKNCHLIIGDVHETVPKFLKTLSSDAPLGFISIDVDYYSSTVPCLEILNGDASHYLPWLTVYLDDIVIHTASDYTGELLAVHEFNAKSEKRKITPANYLRTRRIFKNPQWIDQIFTAHIHDHPFRGTQKKRETTWVAKNEYL